MTYEGHRHTRCRRQFIHHRTLGEAFGAADRLCYRWGMTATRPSALPHLVLFATSMAFAMLVT